MRSIKFKIALLLLFSSLATFAQTDEEIREIQKSTNVDTLRKMGEEFKIRYELKKKKLLQLAKTHSWPVTIDLPNGGKKELIDVTPDMKPVYQEPLNAGSSKMMGADKLYTGGTLGLNVNGESMTAAIFESNIRATHEAFEGRVQYMDTIASTVSSHTTHTAGTIAASGQFQSGQARGIAPKSNVHVYSSNYSTTMNRITSLASNGLLASNHSYYFSGNYDTGTRDLDAIMYNAPFYLSVWACGNSTTYDVNAQFKNGISVAAVEQVNTYTGPGSVVAMSYPGGTWATTPGPSDDGRIKPDISAKGVGVFSTMAYLPGSSTPSNNTYHAGDGTSFASPAIVGSILLLQQHFTNINSRFMRAATVKALIANSAKEAGPNPGPDITFGWGLMDVEKAANTITNNGGKSLISEDKMLNGYSYSREIVADGSEPLVATISWTDPAGPARIGNDTTSALVNDLDLRLSANSTTYFPWKLDWSNGKTSAAGPALQGDNNRDNVEKIEIPTPVAGQVYMLTVNHKGSIGAGQNFSIVITGLKECVATRNIVSPVNSFASVTEQASSAITLSNTLDSNAHAIYHAGDEVVMATGFTATKASQFRAYIEGCTNDYAARLRAVERPVITYPMPISEAIEAELPDNAVYPNPGNGTFKVNLNGIPSGKVEVTGTDGKAIFGKPFKKQSEMEVDIRSSTPGIYILRVVSDQKVLTKKIVKK